VTIFGDSAGSMSDMHHEASKKSKGLFAHAILESGNFIEREWVEAVGQGE